MRDCTAAALTPGGGLSPYWTRPLPSTQRYTGCASAGRQANSAQSAMILFISPSEKLQPCQAGVQPALAHQLGMRALRDDRAALEHHDAVGGLHRGEAVRD